MEESHCGGRSYIYVYILVFKLVVHLTHFHQLHLFHGGQTWPRSYPVTSTSDGGYSDLIFIHHRLLLAWGYVKNDGTRNIHLQHIETGCSSSTTWTSTGANLGRWGGPTA